MVYEEDTDKRGRYFNNHDVTSVTDDDITRMHGVKLIRKCVILKHQNSQKRLNK